MPSKSKSQHNLMAMVAHDPKAAKRVGIPQSVGRDYVEADKGRKFKSGGSTMDGRRVVPVARAAAPRVVAVPAGRGMARPATPVMGVATMKKGGSTGGSYRRAADGITQRGKTKGTEVKMARGGSVGGSYRRAADGITSKGKTKGKMVAMNKGGSCY